MAEISNTLSHLLDQIFGEPRETLSWRNECTKSNTFPGILGPRKTIPKFNLQPLFYLELTKTSECKFNSISNTNTIERLAQNSSIHKTTCFTSQWDAGPQRTHLVWESRVESRAEHHSDHAKSSLISSTTLEDPSACSIAVGRDKQWAGTAGTQAVAFV